jgi:ubiquinone/menaquinone biosynthesis C-methylase UbiE
VVPVNGHHAVCATPEWSEYVRDEVVAFVKEHARLGARMLEIGPGPGGCTEWLRLEVPRLVALELDPRIAAALAGRYVGANVEVVVGDATALSYPDASFDSVGCFTVLHHVPTWRMQNAILSEALRVLRPGGVLVCSDCLASARMHDLHAGDVYNPLDPGSLIPRLQAIGFERLTMVVDDLVKFVARKPRTEFERLGATAGADQPSRTP